MIVPFLCRILNIWQSSSVKNEPTTGILNLTPLVTIARVNDYLDGAGNYRLSEFHDGPFKIGTKV